MTVGLCDIEKKDLIVIILTDIAMLCNLLYLRKLAFLHHYSYLIVQPTLRASSLTMFAFFSSLVRSKRYQLSCILSVSVFICHASQRSSFFLLECLQQSNVQA